LTQPTEPQRLAYGVPEAASMIGVSVRTVFDLIKDGRLKAVKIGGRRLVRREALEALLNEGA